MFPALVSYIIPGRKQAVESSHSLLALQAQCGLWTGQSGAGGQRLAIAFNLPLFQAWHINQGQGWTPELALTCNLSSAVFSRQRKMLGKG